MRSTLTRVRKLRLPRAPASAGSSRLLPSLEAFAKISLVDGFRITNLTAPRRFLSSEAVAPKPQAKNDTSASNLFLDNLGKIFLVVIATIVGSLVRGSYNTSNRNALRDSLEENAALDPVEIDELRLANSELTPEVFRKIMADLADQFPGGTSSYTDFIMCVRSTMKQLKGDAFTIELGHLLDRVVVAVLKENNKSPEDEMPLALWLATLTLALNSSVPDRIKILYEIMENEEKEENYIVFRQAEQMVGYLQETCQLVTDTQIVATEEKWPTQQWRRGTSRDLVPWEGTHRDPIDIDAFASILRSKSVCAWGECYHKRKFESGE